MSTIKYPLNPSLGAIVQSFKRTQFEKITEMIDAINAFSKSVTTAVINATTVNATTSVTTPTILPTTAGTGTSIQTPVFQGEAFGTPVSLLAINSGALCISDSAAGTKWILPAATAANVGVEFTFYVATTVTSNSFDVEAATSSDLFVVGSSVFQTKAATDGVYYSPNGSSNYKLTSNGSTTGGIIGDKYRFVCIGLNTWLISGTQSATGTVATPYAG